MSPSQPSASDDLADPPLLKAFRILAIVVGVLLALFILVTLPMKRAHQLIPGLWPEGSTVQQLGETLQPWVATPHGWIYLVYLIVTFVLSRRAAWSARFTAAVVAAGLIPIMTFVVERRATAYTRAHIASSSYDTDV